MLIQVLKSKIHRVTVTEANLNYIGSITIDQDLIDAAGIIPGERVFIVDNNNGERLDTYVIAGKRGHCDNHGIRNDGTRRSPRFQAFDYLP